MVVGQFVLGAHVKETWQTPSRVDVLDVMCAVYHHLQRFGGSGGRGEVFD